ncbi:MAG: HEAT repeat domain-containing protein [Chloroflexi bacterium]|nr:HEAT repeat domain-containing protein [Chloroflexota bacterium]
MPERHPFNLPGDEPHFAPDRYYRAAHLVLDVEIDPERKAIAGTATYTLRPASVLLEGVEIALDAEDMEVIDVRGAKTWRHEDGKLRVQPNDGERVELAIRYRVEQPERGMYFLEPDEGYPNRPRQIWTQGQAEDSRFWLPSFDFPNQKLTTEVIATVPEGLRVVSNGALVAEGALAGGKRRWHFRQDVPHPAYLMTIAAGEFSQLEDTAADVPVFYYVQPGREDDGRRAFGTTPEMIELFGSKLGVPYPYAKYAQVAVADFIFGGMENTSATTQTDRTLHDQRAHLDFSSEPLVSHELAHQWFGDLVTCRDWSHGWLNEGFATYFECVWREHKNGYDDFLYDVYDLCQIYLGETREHYRRPIVTNTYSYPMDLFDRHLYEKGGLVLHMLRHTLGDDAWWASLKHYLERHRGGNVTTPDLQRAIEDVTGRNVDRFFQQWVYSPGHPDLKVSYSWDNSAKLASITVKQTQDTRPPKDGGPATPLFDLTFELALVSAGGTKTIQAHLDQPERTFAFAMDDEPRRVRFDPGLHVSARSLDLDLGTGMLRRSLTEDEDLAIRIESARALGKKADRESVRALGNALREEKFWGVQTRIARALSDAKTNAAKDALLGAMDLPHPKARRGVVDALGAFREADVAEALEGKARQGDASYFVEAASFRALGKTRQSRAYDTLLTGLDRDSHDDVVRAAVFDGLGELRDDRALDLTLDWTRYGRPPLARAAAVRALEHLGLKEERVEDTLEDILNDHRIASRPARGAAVGVLRQRKKTEALGTLERVAERDPDHRIRRSAREALRALREGSDQEDELRQLRERVDSLAEDNRKLRDRVDKLEASR